MRWKTQAPLKALADGMIGAAQGKPFIALAMFYLVTLIVTELITNNAAAALMFPLALPPPTN